MDFGLLDDPPLLRFVSAVSVDWTILYIYALYVGIFGKYA